MAFCPNCGASVKAEARFCPSCGAGISAAPVSESPAAPAAGAGAPIQTGPVLTLDPPAAPEPPRTAPTPPQQAYVPPTPPQQPAAIRLDPKDVEDNRYLSLFCYLGFFMLIPLIAQPESRYIRYHCNQGLCVIILAFLLTVACIIPILGWIVAGVGYIFLIVIEIMGIVHAIKGEAKPLPLVGKYTILKY